MQKRKIRSLGLASEKLKVLAAQSCLTLHLGLASEKLKMLVAWLCLTLCHSMDCSLPGFPVYGILQVRILEWVAIPFSRASS